MTIKKLKPLKRKTTSCKIARLIRNARVESGYTQEQFAKRIKMKQADLARLESGKYKFIPTLRTIEKIAKGLEMKVDIMFVPSYYN
jgi:transcriptional regulator with XRE-family HTH domain